MGSLTLPPGDLPDLDKTGLLHGMDSLTAELPGVLGLLWSPVIK